MTTYVIINNNDPIIGTHAGILISNGSGITIYDPGGSYLANAGRGSDGTITGPGASLQAYVNYEKMDGPNVKVYAFNTTSDQEQQILDNIDEEGGGFPLGCATFVSGALKGVGPFQNLPSTLTPSGLNSELQKLPYSSVSGSDDTPTNQSVAETDLAAMFTAVSYSPESTSSPSCWDVTTLSPNSAFAVNTNPADPYYGTQLMLSTNTGSGGGVIGTAIVPTATGVSVLGTGGSQFSVNGVSAANFSPSGQIVATFPQGSVSLDANTGAVQGNNPTATINGQTVTLLGLGGSSPFALTSNDNSVSTAGAVSSSDVMGAGVYISDFTKVVAIEVLDGIQLNGQPLSTETNNGGTS